MSGDLEEYTSAVRNALRPAGLLFFGTRGADACSLLELGVPLSVFSLTAPLIGHRSGVCLESLSKTRVDLNTFSLARDDRKVTRQFCATLETELRNATLAVMSYRSSHTLWSTWLASRSVAPHLGLAANLQRAFEHKPWVETELGALPEITTIPWKYFRSTLGSLRELERLFQDTGLVFRKSRGSGGHGCRLVYTTDEVDLLKLRIGVNEVIAVSRYIADALPVTVNACVFPDGSISLHPASGQIVGVDFCSNHPLAFCGSDFAALRYLTPSQLARIERCSRSIGSWLCHYGYRGAFGVDFLVDERHIWFVELNPRFQASSMTAAEIDHSHCRPNQYLTHLGAWLGLPNPDKSCFADIVDQQPSVAKLCLYNRADQAVMTRPCQASSMAHSLQPSEDVWVEPDGLLLTLSLNVPAIDKNGGLFPSVRQKAQAFVEELQYVSTEPSVSTQTG